MNSSQRFPGFGLLARLVRCAVVLSVLAPSLAAQPSAWGLRSGDLFVVDMVFSRRTEIQLGDREPQETSATDLIQVEYLVRDFDPVGDLTVEARIVKSLRAGQEATQNPALDASQQLQLLQGTAVTIRVSPDGVVDAVVPRDLQTLVNQLSGLNTETAAVLSDLLSPPVIASMLGRPFWFVAPEVQGEEQSKWAREDTLSLGLMGQLKASVQCESDGEGVIREVRCTGDARFVPRVSTERDGRIGVQLTAKDVRVTRFEGNGVMNTDQAGRKEQSAYRPYFDSLELTVDFEGEAEIQTPDATIPLKFQQSQQMRMKLSSWRTGRALLVPGGVPGVN